MKESSIICLLRAPDVEIVDFAIRRANLTWKEALAVELCGRRGYTQESAAEHAGYSVDAMQKWYRSGIGELRERHLLLEDGRGRHDRNRNHCADALQSSP